MAATKSSLTVDTEHNGDTLDCHRSDMEDNYDGTLESNYPSLGKNDSLKSTRSLSVFRDPNASKTMARSEEMTYNIYEDFEGVPSMSAHSGSSLGQSETSRQRGTFQKKTATSSNAVPAMTSDSLRNAEFKANLANTLTRRISSEGNTGGSGSIQNGFSHLISMDPSGRSNAKGSSSVSSTLESTGKGASGNGQWNSLSSASSTSTLTSVDGLGPTAGRRGTNPLADPSQSETETDFDHESRFNSGNRRGYSSDQETEVVSHSLPRYSPAEIDVSNSKMKDKDFMARMAAILGGSGTTSPVSASAPASLVRAQKRIEKTESSDNETLTESRTSTLSRDLKDVATPDESQHSTLEGRALDARSQRSTTPCDLRDVINQGMVTRIASELANRNVPLTGRSMDASPVSSMERQPSRTSNHSEDRGAQSKKFKYAVEGIDRPSASETKLTTESEDDASYDASLEHRHKMKMNLLQDIRNRGTAEPSRNSGDVSETDGRSKDDIETSERENSPALEIRGEPTTQTISRTSTNIVESSDHDIDQRSIQSESDETDANLEGQLLSQFSNVDSTSMAGGPTAEGNAVSVEITDGSETGMSYNLEDAAIKQDDERHIQSDNESTTDDQKQNGRHVVTLHLTEDNDSTSNDIRSLPVDNEDTAVERQDQLEPDQPDYSSSVSADDSEHRPSRHRMTNADRLKRTAARPLPEDDLDSDIAMFERNARDEILNDRNESRLTDGSDYSGRQRGKFGGRSKINHKLSNESTSESYVSPESQRPKTTSSVPEIVTSSSRSLQSQQPLGRRIVITGRDNIRRIAPTNDDSDSTVQNGIGHGDLKREFSDDPGAYPQPAPRKTYASDVPNVDSFINRSHSFDRQVTNESGVHISFSSDDSPGAKTSLSPVWAQPRDQDDGPTPEGINRSLIVQLSPDRDVSWNSRRRSLTDSERGRTGGLYEQNRRRSRQKRLSRQVTDSSLTDQEDFDNAGHRSSVMRRRMKRHISRLSIESDTEDPAIYSEPEYVHRESHISKTSTPMTGLITYGRSSSRPILASDITRSPSVPPTARLRPASTVQMSSHRSVTPITGRISVSRDNSRTNISRSATPVAGNINFHNSPRPRSALASSSAANYPNVMNYPTHLAYSPTSPTGGSYLRSVSVLSPDSAEVIAVDPELRDAQKTGNIYHITMSLRPIVSISRPGSVMQAYELVDTAIRSVPRHAQGSVLNGPRTSWLLTEDDLGLPNQSTRPPSSVRPSSNPQSSPGHRPSSQNQVAFHLELQGGETTMKKTVSSEAIDVVPSVSPTRQRHSEMPNIVRGSILIKNTFDTTNPPQVIDVVETDDDDDDVTVIEENSNMFHGKYRLRKENPVYSSNPDLNISDDDDNVDFVQADFAPAGITEPERLDRGRIGKGIMSTRRTGDQRSEISASEYPTDHFIPDLLEFESLSMEDPTTTRTTTTTVNHREMSGRGDDFDRDVVVTRGVQKDRSKAFLTHGGYLGKLQNGDASASVMMDGGGSMMSGVSMTRTSQFARSTSSEDRGQNKIHDPYNDEDFDTEVKVNRDYWQRQRDRTSCGQAHMKMTSSFAKQHQSQSGPGSLFNGAESSTTLDGQSISCLNIRSLMVGTSSSVKQTIKVDRLEDEILSNLPADELKRREAAGLGAYSDPASAFLDFDKVSEQVDMEISDGKVILTSRVRSERTVPIMGSDDMYKKSAVVVTKCIEIDMTLTPQRRQLYDLITSRQNGRNGTTPAGTLDKTETFELYRKFAALADLDRAIAN